MILFLNRIMFKKTAKSRFKAQKRSLKSKFKSIQIMVLNFQFDPKLSCASHAVRMASASGDALTLKGYVQIPPKGSHYYYYYSDWQSPLKWLPFFWYKTNIEDPILFRCFLLALCNEKSIGYFVCVLLFLVFETFVGKWKIKLNQLLSDKLWDVIPPVGEKVCALNYII